MIDTVHGFIQGVSIFYVIYLLLYATFLFGSVVVGAYHLYKRDRMARLRNELKHGYYVPLSLLVPAYNEEVTIVDSVKSLLKLNYRLFEVIVIDDGSSDNTAQELTRAFDLVPCQRPIRRLLDCRPEKAVYRSQKGKVSLTLVCKENGGKGDALNMGINVSAYPWFVCMDADSLLQKDSLEKIAQPIMEDDRTVAVGGLVRVLQCVRFSDDGKIDYKLPKNPIVCMQVMEYDRSFMASRILLDTFNGNLIISGAFGLFKKAVVVAAGGYSTDTMGEDMELVVKLHVFCRNNNIDYAIRYEPNAICWSQVPSNLLSLARQRRRWNIGLFESMLTYRQIFGKLRFGLLGFISYMYYFLYELFSPFIEVFGILTIILGAMFGLLDVRFMLQFLALYMLFGAVLSITAFYQRIYTQNLRVTFFDMVRALFTCIMDIGFFRYILAFVRFSSYLTYKGRKETWGVIKRAKLDTEC